MTYQTPLEYNITNIDGILIYVASAVPSFTIIFLLAIYLGVAAVIYLGTRKFSGTADIFSAFSASGFMTAVVAAIMTLTFGIINLWALSISMILIIISIILLFIKRNRD